MRREYRLRRQGTTFAGAGPLSYRLISARILHDLVEIMVLISLKVPVNRFQPNRFGLQTEGFATELKSLGKFDSVSKRLENNSGRTLPNEEPSYGYKFQRSLPRVFGIVWFPRGGK
jgi:hypothetical protein